MKINLAFTGLLFVVFSLVLRPQIVLEKIEHSHAQTVRVNTQSAEHSHEAITSNVVHSKKSNHSSSDSNGKNHQHVSLKTNFTQIVGMSHHTNGQTLQFSYTISFAYIENNADSLFISDNLRPPIQS